jgi:hypothetical protein
LIQSDKTVAVAVEPNFPVLGESGAIERVLSNLVLNAAEHGGRHIIVRVQGSCLEVEDDGPGIPVDQRERVFEPFQRLRPRQTGAGLGLNLVRPGDRPPRRPRHDSGCARWWRPDPRRVPRASRRHQRIGAGVLSASLPRG